VGSDGSLLDALLAATDIQWMTTTVDFSAWVEAGYQPLWRQVENLPVILGKSKTCRHNG